METQEQHHKIGISGQTFHQRKFHKHNHQLQNFIMLIQTAKNLIQPLHSASRMRKHSITLPTLTGDKSACD